jgi:hypothetical protein
MPGGGYIHTARERDRTVRRVVVPAILLMREGAIELFACGEGGKDHESIFRVEADVSQLDLALVLIGLEKGVTPDRTRGEGGNARREGDRVAVLVQWEENDRTITRWSHDLILDTQTGRPMPRRGWTFLGAIDELVDPITGRPIGRHILLAARSRSIVTTFRDVTSILDNPISETAEDDTRYVPNAELLPEVGTRVRIIFRAPFDGELEPDPAPAPEDK